MFFDRFIHACEVRNIAPTTAILNLGCSKGMLNSWREGGRPRADIIAKMALLLNVSADYLLEISDSMEGISSDNFELEESEASLIASLRSADPTLRTVAFRLVNAILNPPTGDVFLPSNDAKTHHTESKPASEARAFRKKIEGEAAAGAPITAMPDEDSFVSVPEKYLDERYFIVRARGDSMEDTIPNGACCVFQRDGFVENGVIALVQIDGSTDQPDDTIKRVYRRGKQVELCSDNPKYDSMFYPANTVQVTGILVDVLSIDQ